MYNKLKITTYSSLFKGMQIYAIIEVEEFEV